jgi:putative tricarboxylic transport membrane protein
VKNLGVYISVFFLLFGGIMLWQSLQLDYYSDYGPGPGLLPLWISSAIIVFSVLNLVLSLKKNIIRIADVIPKGEGLLNVLACIGAFLLFIIIVPYVGFLIGSTVMLFILFSRGFKWYWAIGLSVLIAGIIFWVFGILLQVPLPVNELGW